MNPRFIFILLSLVVGTLLVYGDKNLSAPDKAEQESQLQAQILEKELSLEKQINDLNNEIKDNIWINKYSNYLTYKQIGKELTEANNQLKRLAKKRKNTRILKEIEELNRLVSNKKE